MRIKIKQKSLLLTTVLACLPALCFSESSTMTPSNLMAPAEEDQWEALVTKAHSEAEDQWDARITEINGKVFIFPSAGEGSAFPAQLDAPLEPGDTVQTGVNGTCDIALDGDSLIHVEKGTTFNVASLSRQDSAFDITFGGILGKFSGLKERNASMEFRTPSGWGSLRGTEIGIETVGKETRMGVFEEGRFAVGLKGSREEVLLTPKMEISMKEREPLGPAHELWTFNRQASLMNNVRAKQQILRKTYVVQHAPQRIQARQNLTLQKSVPIKTIDRQIQRSQNKVMKEFIKQNPPPAPKKIQIRLNQGKFQKNATQVQRKMQERRIQKLEQFRQRVENMPPSSRNYEKLEKIHQKVESRPPSSQNTVTQNLNRPEVMKKQEENRANSLKKIIEKIKK